MLPHDAADASSGHLLSELLEFDLDLASPIVLTTLTEDLDDVTGHIVDRRSLLRFVVESASWQLEDFAHC